MEDDELIPDINIDEEIRKWQEKNNLSEEELKEIKYCIDIWKKGIGYDNPIVYVKPFEKLLDLYNKEKAKLIEYEKQLDLDYVEENYVRKDKIREKINKIDELRNVDGITYDHIILELEELLEE